MGPKIKKLAWWPLRHWLVSVLTIILLAVIGYFIYQQVALRQNKHDFEQARAAIDNVYANIVSQVGQPDDSKINNECSRPYQEFTGYGSLNCDVGTTLILAVSNENEANVIFKKIQRIIKSSGKFTTNSSPSIAIADRFVVNIVYHTASDSYELGSLGCKVNYVYDTSPETTLDISDKINKKPFEVTLGCYGPAKKAYYPLTNQ